MALYIDSSYYTDTFGGTAIPSNEVGRYLELAQEKIDSVTYNRIVDIGFDKLTEFQQEKVKKAICYQAEYIFENGYNDGGAGVASYSVLDISISVDANKQSRASKLSMSEIAYDYIHKTGLAGGVL